jgi:hypothetical protein
LTRVDKLPDGTEKVTYSILNAEQAKRLDDNLRRHRERVAAGKIDSELGQIGQAIVDDSGCDPSSLWLYSGTDLTGNRLCLNGVGITDLAGYTVAGSCNPMCRNWSGGMLGNRGTGYVKSYWPGWNSGDFVNPYYGPGGGIVFCNNMYLPGSGWVNAPYCEAHATMVKQF